MAGNGRRWRKVLSETLSSWDRHDAFTQSAALAFYTLFSLAPVLLVVVSLSGAVFGREKVRGEIVGQFQDLMGKEAGVAVEGLLEKAQSSIQGGLAGILGLATLLFGTTAVFMQLQTALNVVWEVRPKQGHVIKTLLIKRLLFFAVPGTSTVWTLRAPSDAARFDPKNCLECTRVNSAPRSAINDV